MKEKNEHHFLAGRLIQWALRPEASPNDHDDYYNLIELYLYNSDFREVVDKVADGLGLIILPAISQKYRVVLAPKPDSVFSMSLQNYRASYSSADNRLLDGLIHVAIAATVYRRNRDLLEDLTEGRNAVTVDEIEMTLRQIVEQLEENNRENPDPVEGAKGLYEAWRVYKNRAATKGTKDNRSPSGTTRRMIEEAFEDLCRQRCFKKIGEAYKPLWKYQVLIQEYAASRIYQTIQRAINLDQGDI